jgi:hypothetical protein
MPLPEDPELVALAAEYPAWEMWHGIDGLKHARKPGHYDPGDRPVMVWGEDAADLRDQIRRYEGLHEGGDDDGG